MSYDEHLISMAGGDGDVLREMVEHVRAVKAEEAANPERTALIAVMRDNIAWTLEAEPALRKLAEAIIAAGFGLVRKAWDEGAHAALKSEGYAVTDNAAVLKSNPYGAVTVRGGE